MIISHGNVHGQPGRVHAAYERYVAVLDVLGMKAWLQAATPEAIAEKLDAALAACDQASSGSVNGQRQYGPLLGTTYFSDTVLIWSPDDSWTSFATMCSAIKLIVAVALLEGVPLRGAISSGNTVCSSRTLRFVGPAIADAFQWADKKRPYRSVGVDITPTTLEFIRAKLRSDPLPSCWNSWHLGTPEAVLTRTAECSDTLVWYGESLFLNHWSHGIFAGRDPTELFKTRGLELDESARAKLHEMQTFCDAARKATFTRWQMLSDDDHRELARSSHDRMTEFLALEAVRQERIS